MHTLGARNPQRTVHPTVRRSPLVSSRKFRSMKRIQQPAKQTIEASPLIRADGRLKWPKAVERFRALPSVGLVSAGTGDAQDGRAKRTSWSESVSRMCHAGSSSYGAGLSVGVYVLFFLSFIFQTPVVFVVTINISIQSELP